MKKKNTTQTLLIVIAALVAGFLIGYSINNLPPHDEDLAGSIGKVDRYRNVKITEDDIMLRNELVDDAEKRTQYGNYLMYYYYRSLKTTTDVEQVLELSSKVDDFSNYHLPYATALTSFSTYLESARQDLLRAVTLIMDIENQPNVPIMQELNQAQNAISRIRNHDATLMNFMDAIGNYIQEHPDATAPELLDAHDILAINLMQSALLTQNKPVLAYLERKKMLNEKGDFTESVSSSSLESFRGLLLLDAENLGWHNMEQLGTGFTDMEKLHAFMSTEQLGFGWGDSEKMGAVYGNEERLNVLLENMESTGIHFDSEMIEMEFMGLIVLGP
jgi:hypothetical protein